MDFSNLSFSYHTTSYNVRCYHRNGEWGQLEVSSSEQINIHMAATALHYGQTAFEGLKAFKGKDGKIRLFRWEDNAQRLISSAKGILMAEVPEQLFGDAIKKAILLNKDYVPPYNTGASLYIRPLLLGTGINVGVKPADEYLFMVFVTPVGPYFKGGFKPTQLTVTRKYDRAAPKGTGKYKIGGNYAASLRANELAHEHGYSAALFLDPKEEKYIDEAGPANFFGIKGNKYITPKSDSILPSITNDSLKKIAKDSGMEVEERKIRLEELNEFDEAGACGTAAVISPISKVVDYDNNIEYKFGDDENPGKTTTYLYNKLKDIQYGNEPDPYNWISLVD